ncbi:hypothetical protein [Gracilibacillus kekensis]|uniref:Uncharacterized protein n=1 Tax=Gracilibacillus kekensis TaxID=1027249 RepID=A0A1M7PX38_9BACI|nr:hypothetical protein [Gracilibacillus kekensis]SHN22191.1 hypothetical protein SAMN05216179_2523 [Gracilibacillus kekensis]
MKKQKRILFIIDPEDPILSFEHQLFIINRHMSKDAKIDVKLMENNTTFTTLLPETTRVLPAVTTRVTKVIKDIYQKQNWFFKVENPPIPAHIRKAYYTYPSIVELYWKKIKPDLFHPDTYYDSAISFSSGLTSHYLRDKINATQKIYYFPTRLFSKSYQSILKTLQKNDLIYISSQSMYNEMLTNKLFNVKYYADPFYKESLTKISKHNDDKLSRDQQLRILSMHGPTSQRHIEAFIHLCKRLKQKDTNFIWYFYGDLKGEQIVRLYMKKLNIERNIQFIREEMNILLYLAEMDIYVEWDQQSSIYFEAYLLNKPIINLKQVINHKEQTFMAELYSILKIADKLHFVNEFNFNTLKRKYLE